MVNVLFVAFQVIGQLKVLMRSDLEVSTFDKEKWSTELSPVLNLWKRVNQVHSITLDMLLLHMQCLAPLMKL